MKVLFVASECTPFIKTGGLADVVGTLPEALGASGVDVRVIIPKYHDIDSYWREQMKPLLNFQINLGWRGQYCGIEYIEYKGVIYYFVDNEFYFGNPGVYGSGDNEGERFGFFSRAVLSALPYIGFCPDIIHAHDWQAGMVVALLKMQYAYEPFYQSIKTIFTIHNLRYQGLFSWGRMKDILGLDERYFTSDMLEYYGNVSFIKAGIIFADWITTVSSTYAQEIQQPFFGEGLDGLMHARSNCLSGILNGIDPMEYDPETDMWLQHHFSIDTLYDKKQCKRDLQNSLHLQQNENIPVIAIISRLCDQKGLDLIKYVFEDIMRQNVQFVLLGQGDEHYEEFFSWTSWKYEGSVATKIELNNALAHQIYAGADIFLMPSLFEPCGLSQMISMRYGTIPIVRETGGLKDSVIPCNQFTGEGDGFSFTNYDAYEMLHTIEYALYCFDRQSLWQGLQTNAMKKDFSWAHSAKQYIQLYEQLLPESEASMAELTTEQSAIEKNIAAKKPAAKKSTTKKPLTKKFTDIEFTDEKIATKKPVSKKAVAKKPTAEKAIETVAKKPATKKAKVKKIKDEASKE